MRLQTISDWRGLDTPLVPVRLPTLWGAFVSAEDFMMGIILRDIFKLKSMRGR